MVFLFWGHIQLCSGLPSGSVLRDHSGWGSRVYIWCRDHTWIKSLAKQDPNTILSLQPHSIIFKYTYY